MFDVNTFVVIQWKVCLSHACMNTSMLVHANMQTDTDRQTPHTHTHSLSLFNVGHSDSRVVMDSILQNKGFWSNKLYWGALGLTYLPANDTHARSVFPAEDFPTGSVSFSLSYLTPVNCTFACKALCFDMDRTTTKWRVCVCVCVCYKRRYVCGSHMNLTKGGWSVDVRQMIIK